MKFQLMSDIHLEFGDLEVPKPEDKCTLLLAGDVTVVAKSGVLDRTVRFLERQSKNFEHIYAIAGNHEHYDGNIDHSANVLRIATEAIPNYKFMENDTIELEPGLRLFGGTMWTDFNDASYRAMQQAQTGMNDFYIIHKDNYRVDAANEIVFDQRRFKPEDTLELNKTTTEALLMALELHPNDKFIVMTHHTPSIKSSHPRWGGTSNLLNWAYSNTKLEQLILDHPQIKYWVHGHTHESHDYMIGECRVLCNPRGYFQYDENANFSNQLYFEI